VKLMLNVDYSTASRDPATGDAAVRYARLR
jgi:hypothetical protein